MCYLIKQILYNVEYHSYLRTAQQIRYSGLGFLQIRDTLFAQNQAKLLWGFLFLLKIKVLIISQYNYFIRNYFIKIIPFLWKWNKPLIYLLFYTFFYQYKKKLLDTWNKSFPSFQKNYTYKKIPNMIWLILENVCPWICLCVVKILWPL